MLHDADVSLACWLVRVLPAGTKVRFDAPDPGWAARPPDPPFIDAFLYEVREDGETNRAGWSEVRDTDGRVTGRQQSPRRYKLRYLLTAWATGSADATAVPTAGPGGTTAPPDGDDTALPNGTAALSSGVMALPGIRGDGSDATVPGGPGMAEHELLGALLSACVTTDVLPASCLRGTLASAGLPALLRCAPADGNADPARLWAGFGLPPRAFLDLLLIVPVLPPPDRDLAPPAREIALDMAKSGGQEPEDLKSAKGAEEPPAQRRGPQAAGMRWERTKITEHATWPAADAPPPTR